MAAVAAVRGPVLEHTGWWESGSGTGLVAGIRVSGCRWSQGPAPGFRRRPTAAGIGIGRSILGVYTPLLAFRATMQRTGRGSWSHVTGHACGVMTSASGPLEGLSEP